LDDRSATVSVISSRIGGTPATTSLLGCRLVRYEPALEPACPLEALPATLEWLQAGKEQPKQHDGP